MKPQKILIVEDSPLQVARLKLALESQGYATLQAGNGAEALERARREQPDAILSDILMPEMDGFQLCRAIRSDPYLRQIPVILHTAVYKMDEDRNLGIEAGADAYIPKGSAPEELDGLIQQVISAKQAAEKPFEAKPELEQTKFDELHNQRTLFHLIEKTTRLEQANAALAQFRDPGENAADYDAIIEGWVEALDVRAKETDGHSRRVTEMTVNLARRVGIAEHELIHIRRGALLHDIGKMGIPDRILLKTGPLSDEEWVIMRQHPHLAYELLSPIVHLRPALDIPYCHHEKWDGTGYPRGLKGAQIPLAARIFAVVDVWDSLRSDNLYRDSYPDEKVRKQIRALSGTHFDPKIVKAFEPLLQAGIPNL